MISWINLMFKLMILYLFLWGQYESFVNTYSHECTFCFEYPIFMDYCLLFDLYYLTITMHETMNIILNIIYECDENITITGLL
ncbi:hypothetical protein IC582_026117 [Cucumis melo]